LKELFDDNIQRNVNKYRLNKNLKDWYIANKWFLICFFAFPIIMDLIFQTFGGFSLVKGIIILLFGAAWIYFKYFFSKHVLVDQDIPLYPWKYNLYNALLWGLVIAFLAIPSTDNDSINGIFFLNILIVFIIGGLFSLLFSSLEIPRIKLYLADHKKS
jgi:hypothetical protein